MLPINRYTVIGLLLFVSLSACKDDKTVDCSVFQWGYEGESGPDHWSRCTPDCGGQVQSPVDITGAVTDNTLEPHSLNYEHSPINIIHNGHTVEFEYEPGSSLTFEGIEYELLQFHFHAESEHTIAGQHYPLEIHLVHKNHTTGNLAVIGIFFETGNENPFLQQFISDLPDEKDEHFQSAETVNVGDLLPHDRDYYHYNGSLTTPPCSEIVDWILLKTPVSISQAHLQQFTEILHHNNRPVHPLHGRIIRESN